MTHLSISCYPQALFNAYCTSQTYFTILVTAGIHRMFYLLVQEGSSSLDIRSSHYCVLLPSVTVSFDIQPAM